MKLLTSHSHNAFLRLDRGEELLTTLQAWAEERNAPLSSFSCIGAAGKIVLSWYNIGTQQYETMEHVGDVEIVSMTGNISLKEGRHFIHAHGTFSRSDFSVIGGHVHECHISATCEVAVTFHNGMIQRTHDPVTGLFLLS